MTNKTNPQFSKLGFIFKTLIEIGNKQRNLEVKIEFIKLIFIFITKTHKLNSYETKLKL